MQILARAPFKRIEIQLLASRTLLCIFQHQINNICLDSSLVSGPTAVMLVPQLILLIPTDAPRIAEHRGSTYDYHHLVNQAVFNPFFFGAKPMHSHDQHPQLLIGGR